MNPPAKLVPVLCLPAPQRLRPDDRIVELTLQAFSSGTFTHQLAWGPPRAPVKAIAHNAAGVRLAVMHARIDVFEKQPENEPDVRPIAARLETEPALDRPGRAYRLLFNPGCLSKLLRRYREQVSDELAAWAVRELPRLTPRRQPHHFSVSIPVPGGKRPRIDFVVEVKERHEHVRPVTVKCFLPEDSDRWRALLARALDQKLPKLAKAEACQRMLVLEKWMLAAETEILETVLNIAEQRRAWAKIDWLVLADAFAFDSQGTLGLQIWEVKAGEWKECLQIQIRTEESALRVGERSEVNTLLNRARAYVQAAKAQNTLRAYDADWRDFAAWCHEHGRSALPAEPDTVALYLADRAGVLKTASLGRRLTSITRRHQALGHPSPASLQHATVSEVWKGIQRTKGTAQEGKTPLLTAQMHRLSEALPDTLQGARDRALLLAGFAGGFRRSELAALQVADLQETEQGIVVTLRRSKTDPTAQGRPVALPYGSDPRTCPVRALRSWLDRAGIKDGPLFRPVDQFDVPAEGALHPDSVAYLVKRAVARIGLAKKDFAGHSLRAGLATQAAMNGANEYAIMKQTGHRSLTTVRKYIRDGSLFRDNAATKLGL